jgi:hypothetical protein
MTFMFIQGGDFLWFYTERVSLAFIWLINLARHSIAGFSPSRFSQAKPQPFLTFSLAFSTSSSKEEVS